MCIHEFRSGVITFLSLTMLLMTRNWFCWDELTGAYASEIHVLDVLLRHRRDACTGAHAKTFYTYQRM